MTKKTHSKSFVSFSRVFFSIIAIVMVVRLVGQKTSWFFRATSTADSRFGLGVATHGGSGASDDFGFTTINQNKTDVLSSLGLNTAAKTWSVFQLEPNSDMNFLLASYSNYPQYSGYSSQANSIVDGYTGSNWNMASSRETGIPGVGTFIVTHIILISSTPNTSLCGSDGYCIYGLYGQPIVWGQDTSQVGGQHLNYFSDQATYCRIPTQYRRYFDNRTTKYQCGNDELILGYNPVGMISVPGNDLYSSYPNFANSPLIHDIRVPVDYWRSTDGGYIVYGGLYNPHTYKEKNYSDGAFIAFIKRYPGKTYSLFNFPNSKASKWDSHPILPESYSWLYKNFITDGLKQIDPQAKFNVHLGGEGNLTEYTTALTSDYKTRFGNDFPADSWSFTVYGQTTYPYPTSYSSDEDVNKQLYAWGQLIESRIKTISTIPNASNHTAMLIELTPNNYQLYGTDSVSRTALYDWERKIMYRTGKWLKSLSAVYPNLNYYSPQPTFNIPEYRDNNLVPAVYNEANIMENGIRTYSNQILSTSASGLAQGWSQAAQPGASAIYIKDLADTYTNNCSWVITPTYANADGVLDPQEGTAEVQIVINSFPDWEGTQVNSSLTKYGIRMMYVPNAFNNFVASTFYVQVDNCTATPNCVDDNWTPVAINQWFTHPTLGFQVKLDNISINGSIIKPSFYVHLLSGSPLYNRDLNIYAFAEKNSQTDTNPRANLFDFSAGPDHTYSFANFKKIGTVRLPQCAAIVSTPTSTPKLTPTTLFRLPKSR